MLKVPSVRIGSVIVNDWSATPASTMAITTTLVLMMMMVMMVMMTTMTTTRMDDVVDDNEMMGVVAPRSRRQAVYSTSSWAQRSPY